MSASGQPLGQLAKRTGKSREGAAKTDCKLTPAIVPLDMTFLDLERLEAAITRIPRDKMPEFSLVDIVCPIFDDTAQRPEDAQPKARESDQDESIENVTFGKKSKRKRNLPVYEEASSDSEVEMTMQDRQIRRYRTSVIKLSNNRIQKVTMLPQFLDAILVEPLMVTWLDLSFNEITKVPSHISKLEHLVVLYLHGNRVRNVRSLEHLQFCAKLRRFTLHCNPVCQKPAYRAKAVALLPPSLTHFDFTMVTKPDRAGAHSWLQSEGRRFFTDPNMKDKLLAQREAALRAQQEAAAAAAARDADDDEFDLDMSDLEL